MLLVHLPPQVLVAELLLTFSQERLPPRWLVHLRHVHEQSTDALVDEVALSFVHLSGKGHIQLVLEQFLIAPAHRGNVKRCAVVAELVDLVEELCAGEGRVETCRILHLEISLVDALCPAESRGDDRDFTGNELFEQAHEVILLVSNLLHGISRRAFGLYISQDKVRLHQTTYKLLSAGLYCSIL